jgi:hypothetical protein
MTEAVNPAKEQMMKRKIQDHPFGLLRPEGTPEPDDPFNLETYLAKLHADVRGFDEDLHMAMVFAIDYKTNRFLELTPIGPELAIKYLRIVEADIRDGCDVDEAGNLVWKESNLKHRPKPVQ